MDNDVMTKDVIFNYGVYPMPVGNKGIAMVDTRDIAEVAAIELLRRDQASEAKRDNKPGWTRLTHKPEIATIWSEALHHQVVYGGDDPSGFEQNLVKIMPKWMAYVMRLMAERYVSNDTLAKKRDVERLRQILGCPLHSSQEFATQFAASA